MTVWTDSEILRRTIYSVLTCENDGDTVEVIRRACELAGIEMPPHETLGDLLNVGFCGPSLWSD